MRQTGLAKAFLKIKELISFQQFMGIDDPFSDGETERISDPYRSHSLVNIAVSTLMRNIGRASFRITRDGEFVTSRPVFELFRDVNPVMYRFDLWKEWNPWNKMRDVTPLISLSQEIEQDQRANSATTKLLRNNAVPEGILKTDQVLREEEADKLERRWEFYSLLV